MIQLFRLITLRRMTLNPGRLALSILGIACGIALFVAITLINNATSRSFRDSMAAVSGKAKLTVSAGEIGFSEKRLKEVRAVSGVQAAVPVLENRTWLPGSNESLEVLGVDLLQEAQVRTYKSQGKSVFDDSLTFISQPDSIIVTDVFARAHGLKMNSPLELLTVHGKARFVVRGILTSSGVANAYGGALAIMDIDAARMAFGKDGKVDRIDVVTAPGKKVDEVAERIRQALGPSFEVERPSAYARQMEKMVSAFQFISRFFSILALIVGVVFIANSVSMSVAERRKEIGSLRALGATRAGILTLFLAEVIVTGVVGAAIGALAGKLLAGHLVASVTQAMSQQYAQKIDASHLRFTPGMFLASLAVGVAASLAGAFLPSLKTMRISPLEAMKSKEADETAPMSRVRRYQGGVGFLLLAISVSVSWYVRRPGTPWLSILPELGAIIGATLFGPALLTVIIRYIQHWMAGRVSMPFRLAIDNLLRNPRRTAANVVSLLVGLTLVVVLSCVSTSFKGSLMNFFDQVLHADLVISATGKLQAQQTEALSEDLKPLIQSVRGVLGVIELREVKINYQGQRLLLKFYGEPPAPEKPGPRYNIFDIVDRNVEQAGHELFHSKDPVVFVSDNFALSFHKKTGDWIELPTDHGLARFRIIAIAREYANPVGTIFMSRGTYLRFFNDPLVSGFAVKLKSGFDPATVRREIERRLGPKNRVTILLNSDIRGQIDTVIDNSFAYTDTIKVAALMVALLGLLNTLLVSILERKRELGLARAVGMTRSQLKTMILVEAASQGLIGAAIALALGTGLGAIWVKRSLADSLGWIVDFYVPWPALVTTFGLGLLVTLVAAWYPAWRASRLEIVEAIEYE